MNRKELKNIIKECLLEVLRDGLEDTTDLIEGKKIRKKAGKPSQAKKRLQLEEQRLAAKRQSLEIPQIRGIPKELNDAIFSDTLQNTLTEQAGAPDLEGMSRSMRAGMHSSVQTEGVSSDSGASDGDVETPGGTTWANLAFMPTRAGKKIR